MEEFQAMFISIIVSMVISFLGIAYFVFTIDKFITKEVKKAFDDIEKKESISGDTHQLMEHIQRKDMGI